MISRELRRPDVTLHYWDAGPRRAPTVLLLHGATLDHRSWDPQVEMLRAGGYRVVTVDLRGHGLSAVDGRFSFEAAVDDVRALIAELEPRRLVRVGLSLGANIAQEIVYREPGLVDALVIADATCNTASRHPMQASMASAALAPMGMGGQQEYVQRAARATAKDPEVQAYVASINADRPPREAADILRSLLSDGLHVDPDYRLPVPTLLIHGAEDRVGDVAASAPDWAEREPRVTYVVVPEAGHASNLDNPAVFNAALVEFLSRTVPPRRAPGLRALLARLRGR